VKQGPAESRWRRFYLLIERIPEGRVATYGQIAALAGLARHARQVGYALAALPEESTVPWQRVVNAKGEVSRRSADDLGRSGYQRHLLEEEGVVFDLTGRIDLERFGWRPRTRRRVG
jgi:methylated-DNA-protein-cysteine methyltransferase-like protein